MSKTKALKFAKPDEIKPVEMIGTRRWKESVPRHLQVPLAKALRAMEDGNLGLALQHFGECAEIEPLSKPVLYFGAEAAARGYFLKKAAQPDHPLLPEWRETAENLHRYLCELDPTDAVASHTLGRFLQDEGRDAEAIQVYRHTMLLDSNQLETYGNLGTALYTVGEVSQAWEAWEKCLQRPAVKASEHIAQAYIYLRKGDYVNGWRSYNERWSDRAFNDGYGRKDLDTLGRRWDGTPLAKGQSLYLHGEQGGGDHIQFARYVPLLRSRGIEIAGLETRENLARWMESSLTEVPIIVRGRDELPAFTHHCSTLDLPGLLGTTLETIPPPLAPTVEKHLLENDGVNRLRVGIAWEGAKGNTADYVRSIPASELRHLADIPGVTWVNLQFAPDAAMTARAWLGKSVIDGTEGCSDVLDTAAVMRGLDLVVTVDTMTLHLAGSLRVPSLSLHRLCREWRHGDVTVTGEKNPWYSTDRMITQTQPGDWADVLSRVRANLESQS